MDLNKRLSALEAKHSPVIVPCAEYWRDYPFTPEDRAKARVFAAALEQAAMEGYDPTKAPAL